jgi:Flp pilus assembly protein TadG
MARTRPRLTDLVRDRRGAAAIEFAITGVCFFGLVLFVISLAYRLYVQVALDYAVERAARMLAVNTTQSLSSSSSAFQTVTFCPLLSPFLSCANVSIALTPVTDYRTTSSISGTGTPPFNPGQGGSLMLLQANYLMPSLGWPMPGGGSSSFGGTVVTADYPYQNEY